MFDVYILKYITHEYCNMDYYHFLSNPLDLVAEKMDKKADFYSYFNNYSFFHIWII